jgi:hypothetical protein
MKLGNGIPAHERQAAYASSLTPGGILHRHCEFTNPPKPKFLVLVGVDEGFCLLLVINTRPPRKVQNTPSLLQCQVLLSASEYTFLDHDSFLDCAEVIDSVPVTSVAAELALGRAQVRQGLSAASRAQVVEAVLQAHTVSDWHKTIVVEALTAAG